MLSGGVVKILDVKVKVAQSCLTLCDPVERGAHQAPLSMGFCRQEYWSGLPCPPPGIRVLKLEEILSVSWQEIMYKSVYELVI